MAKISSKAWNHPLVQPKDCWYSLNATHTSMAAYSTFTFDLAKPKKNMTKNVQVTWAVVSSWRSQFEDLGAKWKICHLEKLRSQQSAIHRRSIKDVKTGNADGSRKALDRTQWCHKQLAFHFGFFTAFDKQPLNFYWPSKKLTRTFNPTSKKYQWCQAMFHTQWGRQ